MRSCTHTHSTNDRWSGKRHAFTLIELIVVIVILGILAALAIVYLGNESHSAQRSVLENNAAQVQRAIDRYYIEHKGNYPAAGLPNGSTKRPTQDPGLTFLNQLLKYSDIDGNTSDTKDDTFKYGPYLQAIPENPLARDLDNPASVYIFDSSGPIGPGGGRNAWRYSWRTGRFIYNLNPTELDP